MSGIEWTEKTWNPLAGCSPVSEGCRNCYAIRQAGRLQAMGHAKYAGTTERVNGRTVWTGRVNLDETALTIPLRRRRRTTWFVNSMSDLFHPDVPLKFVDKVFAVMALCPRHTFQVLTKRAERMVGYLRSRLILGDECGECDEDFRSCDIIPKAMIALGEDMGLAADCDQAASSIEWPLPNVWLGTSVEDQAAADERIPHLLKCPAAVRFLSCEPLLEPIRIPQSAIRSLNWVIVGGESGPGARPCDVGWIRAIVEQCVAAEVPCFVKQLGARAVDAKGFSSSCGTAMTVELRQDADDA